MLRKILLLSVVFAANFVGSVTMAEVEAIRKELVAAWKSPEFNPGIDKRYKIGILRLFLPDSGFPELREALEEDSRPAFVPEAKKLVLKCIKLLHFLNISYAYEMSRGENSDYTTYSCADFNLAYELPEGYLAIMSWSTNYIDLYNKVRHLLKDVIIQICDKYGFTVAGVMADYRTATVSVEGPRRSPAGVAGVGAGAGAVDVGPDASVRAQEQEIRSIDEQIALLTARRDEILRRLGRT